MTVLERKAMVIRRILDANDQEFERVEEFLNCMDSKEYPCQHSVEAIRRSAQKASEEYRKGNTEKFIAHEELLARYNSL